MVERHLSNWIAVWMSLLSVTALGAEQAGSIRGMLYDSDFDAPLAAGQVMIAETGQTVVATDEGNYVFGQVAPGNYTLVFSKEGYTRQVKADVVVSPGQMTEVNASLAGEFEDMDEFVVQDVQIGTGTEAALLDLRMESPALMDSISSDLMSQAGASDAASALKLVSGATVQDGKYATIRGLPDRYVNSQLNGVRLPTADADKRAVQLDQFPSAIIESVQVTKTFTPDQQGDASGGAVNVTLKGIPEETSFKLSVGTSFNTNVKDAGNDFLSYRGGGVNTWGQDNGSRDIPADPSIFEAAGVSDTDGPIEYKWSLSGGGKYDFEDFRIGGFFSFFYEKDSAHRKGIDNAYWGYKDDLNAAGATSPFPMTPQFSGDSSSLTTSLFDVTQSAQQVQWGGLGLVGIENEFHSLSLLYMYTRTTEDKATLAEDTRGKEYYFPGYDITDPTDPGNDDLGRGIAPYLRYETLEYTERTMQTLQLQGRHTLADMGLEFDLGEIFSVLTPELDWTLSTSSAELYQPDKRLFGSFYQAEGVHSRFPFITYPEGHYELKPASQVTLGNFQRIWKDITEDSDQFSLNYKIPFEQWSGDEGYVKVGLFNDEVNRKYDQDSYSNSDGDDDSWLNQPWSKRWSSVFPFEGHEMFESYYDVDYKGEQSIKAWYYMVDMPLNSQMNFIGGMRFEETDLSITNTPDRLPNDDIIVKMIEPGGSTLIDFDTDTADVDFSQRDALPSLGFEYKPWEQITLRGSYSETVARQTFKELSPIMQMDYLGGDVFVGNPGLQMSALKNYDFRLDWTPYPGGLFSFSYFYKDVTDPIEYVKGFADFSYTYPTNYPEGNLSGYEIEIRQQLGHFWENLEGLTLGANATLIDSEVTLPDDEAQLLADLGLPMPTRDMTNAPEHLYNIFMTYDLGKYGTQLGLFYTIRGDTLVAGAGQSEGNFIPNVYETEYGSLNFSLSQKLGDIWTLKFQAKNLLDPDIETIYRSDYTRDITKTSYTKGRDFSISLSARF